MKNRAKIAHETKRNFFFYHGLALEKAPLLYSVSQNFSGFSANTHRFSIEKQPVSNKYTVFLAPWPYSEKGEGREKPRDAQKFPKGRYPVEKVWGKNESLRISHQKTTLKRKALKNRRGSQKSPAKGSVIKRRAKESKRRQKVL